MRRTMLLLASMALVVLLAGGVALAATIDCPNREGDLCVGTDEGDDLIGTNRDDTMRGREGNDYMHGLDGDDTMVGGQRRGVDTIIGGRGMDRLGGVRSDRLEGRSGNDRLLGGDVLLGGGGQDHLLWGRSLFGEDGNDNLVGGRVMYGGGGNDTIQVFDTDSSKVVYVDAGPGEDLIRRSDWLANIHAVDGERDVIRCSSHSWETVYADDIDEIDGSGCFDVIIR